MSDLPVERAPTDYRPDIDGLRALAIIAVVAYHLDLGIVQGGFAGVDVFFVISGYLIGSLIYKQLCTGDFKISKFYARRAKRILPALFTVLIFSYIIAITFLSPHEIKVFSVEAIAAITSSSNLFYSWLASGYFTSNSKLNPLLMTWSLGVEEQFYLVIPFVMALLYRRGWKAQIAGMAAAAAGSLLVSIVATRRYPNLTFFLLPARAWELAIGILIGLYELRSGHRRAIVHPKLMQALGIAGIGMIVLAFFSLTRDIPYPGSAALLPVIGTSLVVLGRPGIANDLLSWSPLVFVGKISYSWYLIHWPMLSFARIICNGDTSREVRIAIACISFLCAVASYIYIEQPFRRSTIPAGALLRRYGAFALAMALPPIVFFGTQGIAHSDRVVRNIDMANRNLGQDKCLVQSPESHPRLNAICVPQGSNNALAIVGDSHAAALAGALRIVGQGFNYRIEELTKGFCTPAGGVRMPDNLDFSQECAQFDEEVWERLGRDSKVKVVVLAGYWPLLMKLGFASSGQPCDTEHDRCGTAIQANRSEMLSDRLSAVIDRLEKMGKVVYVVQDNPEFSFDPLGIMRTHLIERRQVVASLLTGAPPRYPDGIAPEADIPDHRRAWMAVHSVALSHPATREIDSPSKLCISGGCRFAAGNEVLYIDSNHLSQVGAQSALAELRLP